MSGVRGNFLPLARRKDACPPALRAQVREQFGQHVALYFAYVAVSLCLLLRQSLLFC